MPDYRVLEGTPQYDFGFLRTKVQVFGGGFGNGKTAAAVVQKVLRVAKDYPGANILVARSTYPKLNDTIRKEFLKWCPPKWIKSFPRSKNSENTCYLKNGSVVNFRYIAQQGKGSAEGEQTTSNLLSATYDLVVVDQMEDPEIVHKDFLDLLGRLRGSARYVGDDPTMPLTGPRWFVICLNPTRNWCFKKLVKPLLDYKKFGTVGEDLLCERDDDNNPILDEKGKPELLISLVEGATHTNSHNLEKDFIKTLEAAYTGSMRKRFLLGEWAAYEGLIYQDFEEAMHMVPETDIIEYLDGLMQRGVILTPVEGYDFGNIVPSCYLFGFADRRKNVIICDGFYMPTNQMNIEMQQKRIYEIRSAWAGELSNVIICDPQIKKKTSIQKTAQAQSIAEMFADGQYGVRMRGGDNSISAGITKVASYLAPFDMHRNPFDGSLDAPHLYFNDKLKFIAEEMNGYYWKKDTSGDSTDIPIDKNDHAMDTIKYIVASRPDLAQRIRIPKDQSYLRNWTEAAE